MKTRPSYTELPSFDDLKLLANRNPEAFDHLREFYCKRLIDSVPEKRQHRLYCLQNRVDLEVERAKTPMAAVIMISGMMHESVENLAYRFNTLTGPEITSAQRKTADIIPFPKSN